MSNTTTIDTAMREAFDRAGWRNPRDHAIEIAVEAWTKWSTPSRAPTRRNYLKERLTDDMIWQLLDRWQYQGATKFLNFVLEEAARTIRTEAPSPEKIKTKKSETRHQREKREEAKRELQRRLDVAAEATAHFDYTHPEEVVKREIEDHSQYVAEKTRRTVKAKSVARLNTFLIDGTPLADCTAREALAWCDRQERDVEFVRNLCHGVPLDDTLGRWYGTAPLEVEEIWQRVNSDEARAMREALKAKMIEEWAKVKALADELGADGAEAVAAARALLHRRRRDAVPDATSETPKPWELT